MELNLEAPIIPGQSVAGISLGQTMGDFKRSYGALFTVLTEPGAPFQSQSVRVWMKNDVVDQIGVSNGYLGKIAGKIGIGSKVIDIEPSLGPIYEDDEDNLRVRGLAGLCFESDEPCPVCDGISGQVITEIFVFKEMRQTT